MGYMSPHDLEKKRTRVDPAEHFSEWTPLEVSLEDIQEEDDVEALTLDYNHMLRSLQALAAQPKKVP